MPKIIGETENDQIAAEQESIGRSLQRQRLIEILPEIVSQVAVGLRAAGLAMQVFFTVPRSGAFITFGTPIDPSDADWDRASNIICGIVEGASGIEDLIIRNLDCMLTEPMGVADVVIDVPCSTSVSPGSLIDW
jgi:hypothetical protein